MKRDILREKDGTLKLLDSDGTTTSLNEIMYYVAFSLYENLLDFNNENYEQDAERTALIEKIKIKSDALNALSNADGVIKQTVTS